MAKELQFPDHYRAHRFADLQFHIKARHRHQVQRAHMLCQIMDKLGKVGTGFLTDLDKLEGLKNGLDEMTVKQFNAIKLEKKRQLCAVIEEHEGVKLDLSHTDQGYFMAAYTGSADKLLIQVEGGDNIPYRYYFDPDGKYNALPLTAGDGSYAVTAYENVGDNRYAVVFTKIVDVTLENEVLPFLYSNQYVNFDENTKTVALAKKLTKGKTEIEAVQEVYEYVIKNIVYDDEKAATVKSGYLPNVDDTLKTKKGICFDYAALMTAMLRSSGIPTRLDIGYATNIYHAWISTYLDEQGWVDNVIKFDGKNWSIMDPTLAANNSASDVKKYVGNGKNYVTKYTY